MKTRNYYKDLITRNAFFDSSRAWDDLFVYRNPDFTAEECGLIEDVCKNLSNSTDRPAVKEFINGLIERGGVKYLHCVLQHLDEKVLPRVAQMHRMATSLENQQRGRWQEHIKVISNEYTTLSVNQAVLKEMLTAHQPKPVSGKR
jgi:hypothetical protein